jgi:hypothetical protein
MGSYEEIFQEYQVIKERARRTGVPIATLLRFKDRDLRNHLITLHSSGEPLAGLVEYLNAFYQTSVTPQQLRKILKTDKDAWIAASESYLQHRQMKQHEKVISSIGASL